MPCAVIFVTGREPCVCTLMYMGICTRALSWVLFFTTCTATLLEGRTSKLETAEGWRRGSPALLLQGPVDPVDPKLRLGLKPEDTGKVKQKSNLGPMLQFQPGKFRIFPRAEIIQAVSKNTCNL